MISSSSLNLLAFIFRFPLNSISPTTFDSTTSRVILTSFLSSSSYLIWTSSNNPNCHNLLIALGNSDDETFKPFLKPDVKIICRESDYGAIVSPEGADLDIALRWVAMDPIDTTIDGIMLLNHATNLQEAKVALERFHAPAQNAIVTTRSGDIVPLSPHEYPCKSW